LKKTYRNTASDASAADAMKAQENVKKAVQARQKRRGKSINLWGVAFMVQAIVHAIPWGLGLVGVKILSMLSGKKWDEKRDKFDQCSRWWARAVLRASLSIPQIEGLENMPPADEPVMFVANHCSWVDIIIISMLPHKYKFVSKAEMLKVPFIGQSLKWGEHVLLAREDRKSQMKAFREGVSWLERGVSLATFPEGTRSKDGRLPPLRRLRRGAFKMALRTGARIVPVSLVGTHEAMPVWALAPVKPAGKFMKVVVHPPIDTKDREESEVIEEAYEAIKSGLPESQK